MLFRTLCACARLFAPLLVVASIGGCGASSKIEPGTYRAVLELAGEELPFTLELVQQGGKWTAYFVNGVRREPVTDVTVDGGKLEIAIPGYTNRLNARMRGGKLTGKFTLFKRGDEEQEMAFTATPGETWRFHKEPLTDNADVSGRWRVTFTTAEARKIPAIAEFEQKFDLVTGTFLTTTGDYGYLAGEMRDDELRLSTFDGGRAYLLEATLSDDGSLQGTWLTGSGGRQEFVAQRDRAAELEDPDKLVQVSDATWHLGFTYSDESGKPVSLADSRFRDKVVVVSLLGSWCPNSHDAMAYLTPLYREQRARGVEVIALMFENSAQFDSAARAVKALRNKYGADFATLIAGVADKAKAAEQLPLLTAVHAFPTLLFLDRKGRVRRVYSGFDGPATGAHYEQMTRSFADTLDTLLEEKPD